MARLGARTASLVALAMVSACAVGYPRQLDLIEDDPLADTDLLGLTLISASEGEGMRGREPAYVFRSFESPAEPSLQAVTGVKEVAEESGWSAERCVGKPSPGGNGQNYILYMTKRDAGLVAVVSADQTRVTVRINGTVPGGAISLLPQRGEPDC